jgi:predicted ATPase/DNA-binding NarL/FixJ family response regulator/DNA-binding XRE family transcriptional regulator
VRTQLLQHGARLPRVVAAEADDGEPRSKSRSRAPESIGGQIRLFRERAGLSQEALAERAGLGVSTLAAIERNRRRRPHPHTIEALARALQLTRHERSALHGDFNPSAGPPPLTGPMLPPTNLPALRTRLIGRMQDVAQVRGCLTSIRLTTVTGTGGVGKTSLALQVAHDVRDMFADGVWWVELAPIADAALVGAAVADALGVRQAPHLRPEDAVIAFLANRQALLVLDNCEHVVEACAHLAADVLNGCPGSRLLATSREPLLVRGEHQLQLAPLMTGDLDAKATFEETAQVPAVQLFVERAQEVSPDFLLTPHNVRDVASVCARLDGLPLAVELAAARARMLAPAQILERLDDRFGLLVSARRVALTRHQTLRAALDWSYRLLSEPERAVLRCLAVLAGDCDLRAVEAVCADFVSGPHAILDLLTSLVDKSLVIANPGEGGVRYRLLETVRDYARERLGDAGLVVAVRARHAAWYLALAESVNATGRLIARTAEEPDDQALARLRRDEADLRAALRWCIESQDAETGLRLGAALAGFWYVRGRYAEGRAWLDQVLALPTASRPTSVRVNVLAWAGDHAYCVGDHATARALMAEGQAIAEQIGDEAGRALCLQFQGNVARAVGELSTARSLYEAGLAICRRLEDPARLALALILVAFVDVEEDHPSDAAVRAHEALSLYRQQNNTWGISRALYLLGRSATQRDDHATARAWLLESLALERRLDDRQGLTMSLLALAHTALHQGELATSHQEFAEALAFSREAGDRLAMVRCLEGMAALNVSARADDSVRLLAAAQALRAVLQAIAYPSELKGVNDALARARRALPEEAYSTAWTIGGAMSLQQAVATALDMLPPPAQAKLALTFSGVPIVRLTAREREVVPLVVRGCTDRQIAAELGITRRTAGLHVRNILGKLDLRSRWQIGDRVAAGGPEPPL